MHTTPVTQIVPIFSGGGTRLSAYLGILNALDELGISYPTVVGVSGGAIIAALHTTGWQHTEIRELAKSTDFRIFREYSLWRLLREGGLGSGDVLEDWLDSKLQGKTFAQTDKPLHVVATDVANSQPVIFNAETTPDIKISQAVRYSMSIPLLFSFKEFEDKVLTDGAILSEDALFRDWHGDRTPSVCFRLQGRSHAGARQGPKLIRLPTYVMMLIRTFMDAVSREYVHRDYWNRTLVIDTKSISATDFALQPVQKDHLFQLGRGTVLRYLPNKLCRPAAI